jgi:serine/threonine-protein kinase
MNARPDHTAYFEVEARAAVSPADVRDALERILSSSLFLNARRPSQFLHFVVESTLAGRADQIKEYLIGVEVFERPADYDPKVDPIVRIEAGRLRKKLAEYYSGPGGSDSVIIELPKGGYVPVFQPRPRKAESESAEPEIAKPALAGPLAFWVGAALVLIAALALASTYYVRLRHRSAGPPTSIAVLPFLDLGAGSAGQYLSDGLTEELTTGLAELNGLRVVAATSAFQFRGRSEDIRQIGQALNAEALLEGSINHSGSGLRINAQLINARNGYHLWSKGYDVTAADMNATEEDIVQETARVLRVPVSNTVRPIKRDTQNPEAHDLYLQGRYLWNTRQVADMQESARLFERAVKADPNYALAYAGVADAYTVMAVNQQMSPSEAVPLAKPAIQRALELDPNLAAAHATLGLLESQCEWNWHGAEREFQRAIELQPNYAQAHQWAGLNYMVMGKFAAAEAEFRQAQVLDPLSLMITEGLAENFFYSRRYDEAISTVLNMPDRRVRIGWSILARAYIFKGMHEEALRLPEVVEGRDINGLTIRAQALALSGDRAGALKILGELESNRLSSGAVHNYISPAVLAMSFATVGEKERAFVWIEKAYQQHDPLLAELKIDPSMDSLRSDPRYIEMLKKLGLSD